MRASSCYDQRMTSLRSITVELTEEQIDEIQAHASGAYTSASAVISAGLAELLNPVWNESLPEGQAFLAECDEIVRRIDAGLDPSYTLDEVMETLRADLIARGDVHRPAAE